MVDDLTTQETIVIASFPTRIEADTAGEVLDEHGIDSIVLEEEAQCSPLRAVPARLAVLRWQEDDAIAVLQEASLLSDDVEVAPHDLVSPWAYAAVAALIAAGIVAVLALR